MTSIFLVKYPQATIDQLKMDEQLPGDDTSTSTEQGNSRAATLGEGFVAHLSGRTQIWSSPSRRCLEPATIIARAFGEAARTDVRLGERKLAPDGAKLTVGEFRRRQEHGYLDPSTLAEGEVESPFMHRTRVEMWLSDVLSVAHTHDNFIVVSHGAVIEHLHSSLSARPADAMATSFQLCTPGNVHVWSSIELPDRRRLWGCLGTNIDFSIPLAFDALDVGMADLHGLAVNLATDPRYAVGTGGSKPFSPGNDVYYIR